MPVARDAVKKPFVIKHKTSQNQPKPPTTTKNYLQSPTTNQNYPQPTKSAHNYPKPPIATQKCGQKFNTVNRYCAQNFNTFKRYYKLSKKC